MTPISAGQAVPGITYYTRRGAPITVLAATDPRSKPGMVALLNETGRTTDVQPDFAIYAKDEPATVAAPPAPESRLFEHIEPPAPKVEPPPPEPAPKVEPPTVVDPNQTSLLDAATARAAAEPEVVMVSPASPFGDAQTAEQRIEVVRATSTPEELAELRAKVDAWAATGATVQAAVLREVEAGGRHEAALNVALEAKGKPGRLRELAAQDRTKGRAGLAALIDRLLAECAPKAAPVAEAPSAVSDADAARTAGRAAFASGKYGSCHEAQADPTLRDFLAEPFERGWEEAADADLPWGGSAEAAPEAAPSPAARSPLLDPRPFDVVRVQRAEGEVLAICDGYRADEDTVSLTSLYAGGERRHDSGVPISVWREVMAGGEVVQVAAETTEAATGKPLWEPPVGGFDYGLPRSAVNMKGWKHGPDEHYPVGHRSTDVKPSPTAAAAPSTEEGSAARSSYYGGMMDAALDGREPGAEAPSEPAAPEPPPSTEGEGPLLDGAPAKPEAPPTLPPSRHRADTVYVVGERVELRRLQRADGGPWVHIATAEGEVFAVGGKVGVKWTDEDGAHERRFSRSTGIAIGMGGDDSTDLWALYGPVERAAPPAAAPDLTELPLRERIARSSMAGAIEIIEECDDPDVLSDVATGDERAPVAEAASARIRALVDLPPPAPGGAPPEEEVFIATLTQGVLATLASLRANDLPGAAAALAATLDLIGHTELVQVGELVVEDAEELIVYADSLLKQRPLTAPMVRYADSMLRRVAEAAADRRDIGVDTDRAEAIRDPDVGAWWARVSKCSDCGGSVEHAPDCGADGGPAPAPAFDACGHADHHREPPPPDPSPAVTARLDEQRLRREFSEGLDGLAKAMVAAKALGIKVSVKFSNE